MKRNTRLLILFVLAVSLFIQAAHTAQADEWQTLIEDLVIRANDWQVQEESGVAINEAGLTLADGVTSISLTTVPMRAPFPFNVVVPQWVVDLPENSHVEIQLRSSDDTHEWSAWREIHPSPDMTLPADQNVTGELSFVPGAAGTHRYVQVMITLHRSDLRTSPVLRELRLTFIDSTAGPTTDQLVALQQILDQQAGANQTGAASVAADYPKPFVVSRDIWCTSQDCDYSEGLEYQPVTHLILHHTVGIPDGDSAAQIRAYWAYHTYTRGWGDIGYNFLIDLDGVVFEGHLGGDDVIGTHASGANAGSMGVAMIGNYTSIEPSVPVQEAIIDLFAWKADQRNIDVFDASDTLPNMDWGLPHVMGHRDVYGTTECPGTIAHRLIPAIRDEVAARIGLESPHLYVDELSPAFIKSNAYWYTGEMQCGYNTHAWHTWSTTNPGEAVNWGEWRPDVPVAGLYQIEAYIPYCRTGRSETAGAHYTIQHASGTSDVVVSHQQNLGLWALLGEYRLNAGSGNVIHLTDLTTTDDGLGLWFDALRLLPLQAVPTATNEMPVDKSWLTNRQVPYKWHIENPEEVAQTIFQVATDDQFQNLVTNKEWPNAVESVTHLFDQDYSILYWRVVLRSKSGGDFPSAFTSFGIDTEPPTSSVKTIIWLEWSKQYKVSWSGIDALNRVAHYDIEVRRAGESWEPWLNQVTGTNAYFSPPAAGVYEFRSRATDSLGNVEAEHTTADTSTDEAESLDHAIILPIIYKN